MIESNTQAIPAAAPITPAIAQAAAELSKLLHPAETRIASAVPLHKHGAFDDLQARLSFIQLGADALKGLGAMMQPAGEQHQMNQAFSSDAAAVFRFFGEALENPAIGAYEDMERLQRAARGEAS